MKTRTRHWSANYKKSINCNRPRGFSQRQHCKYGRKRALKTGKLHAKCRISRKNRLR